MTTADQQAIGADQPEPDAKAPPRPPTLTAEWRLAVTFPSGVTVTYDDVDSYEAATKRGRKFVGPKTTWRVEKRLVSAWMPATPMLRTRVESVEPGATDTEAP